MSKKIDETKLGMILGPTNVVFRDADYGNVINALEQADDFRNKLSELKNARNERIARVTEEANRTYDMAISELVRETEAKLKNGG